MRQHCDEGVSGWLHLGRSSPSLRVVASRIAFRKHLLGIMSSANEIRATLINVAERHIETLMPGYAYLQHIEPTTFGHYLMSWVEPLERDFERFATALKNTNISSVGTGAAYGIEFDVNLERLDELMGFEKVPCNARDSIRNYDYMIETYMALALMHNTLGKLAMDFLIWHSVEFGFIEIPDRLCITSSISPQMRNPYVFEFVHGASGLIAGRLMTALSVTKTASDQLEMATILPSEFWECAVESGYAIASMVDAIENMKVHKERMAQVANDYWSQMNAVIGYLVKERDVPFRTAHQILAKLMRRVAETKTKPQDIPAAWLEQAVSEYTGKELKITQDALKRIFDAMYSVRERKFRGGAAPERVLEHIAEARRRLNADNHKLTLLSDGILSSEHKLESAFSDLKKQLLRE